MRNKIAGMLVLLSGCASPWKIHGGPKECVQMCRGWGMELTGMVGVGNQDRSGYGATACVCEVPRPAGTSGAASTGAVGMATGTAAVVVALEEALPQQEEQRTK